MFEEYKGLVEFVKEFARITDYAKQIVEPIKKWYDENSAQLRAFAEAFHDVGVRSAAI